MCVLVRRISPLLFSRCAIILCGCLTFLGSHGWSAEPAISWQPTRPARELELLTGERLLVEDVHSHEGGVTFRWQEHTRCRLPFAMIRSIANPMGWIDRMEESFESLPTTQLADVSVHRGRQSWNAISDQAWIHELNPPIANGELALWWNTPHSNESLPATTITLTFDTTSSLLLTFHSDGTLSTVIPRTWRQTFSQALKPIDRWTRLAIVWKDARYEIRVNNALHSVLKSPPMRLQHVAITGPEKPRAALAIDDVVLREFDEEIAARPAPARTDETQDHLTLRTGDKLFGELIGAETSGQITLQNDHAVWSGDWSEAIRIDFARRKLPAYAHAPMLGWFADLTGEPRSNGIPTFRAVQMGMDTLRHPWLGTLAWSPDEKFRKTNVGFGEFRWLEPDRRHLGDEIRIDLSPTVPVGTSIAGTWELSRIPVGQIALLLDVAEMEPSGPETIPTQPFLDALRSGGLRTEVLVNDHLVTDLNRMLTVRTPVTSPERVRVPLPKSVLRAGTNTWTIRQRPLSPAQHQFDDAEVGRIALWISPF